LENRKVMCGILFVLYTYDHLVEQRDDGVGVPGVERVLVREREAGRVDDPGIGAFLGVHGCLTPRVGSIRTARSRRDHLAASPRNRVHIKPTLPSRPRTPWFARHTVAELTAAFAGTSVPWGSPDRGVDSGAARS
jgi:hypothetical protein